MSDASPTMADPGQDLLTATEPMIPTLSATDTARTAVAQRPRASRRALVLAGAAGLGIAVLLTGLLSDLETRHSLSDTRASLQQTQSELSKANATVRSLTSQLGTANGNLQSAQRDLTTRTGERDAARSDLANVRTCILGLGELGVAGASSDQALSQALNDPKLGPPCRAALPVLLPSGG